MRTIPLLKLASDYVAFHAELLPEKVFLWSEDRAYSYQEAQKLVDDCAIQLLSIGVERGDRVAWYGNPTPECLIHKLATGSMGAIWTGLNPKYTESELAHVIGDAKPKHIFAQVLATGEDRSAELQALGEGCGAELIVLGLEAPLSQDFETFVARESNIEKESLQQVRENLSTQDPSFIVYTSGSTGRPKGALLSHYGENFCNIIAVDRKGLSARKIICNLPINHVGAISDICGRALTGGGTIYFQEQFNPLAMMQLIEKEKIEIWGAVPAVFQLAVANEAFNEIDLTSVELIAWGGARMPRELIQTLKDKTGAKYCTMGYGMTETVGGVSYCRLDDDLDVLSETIGTPDPRQPLRLWHDEGRPVCPGESGEIQVQGDFVMRGYWGNPKATKEAFTEDGWMKTGDVAIVRSDGNLEIVGRLSEMFKSGGYNVYPREIELALEGIESIALVAVVSRPDPTFQEVGHAFYILHPDQALNTEKLKVRLKETLANYKIPKYFTQLDLMPMLPIGKIDKKKLQAMANAD